MAKQKTHQAGPMTRQQIDEHFRRVRRQRAAATLPAKQAVHNPYIQGLQNLIEVLTGQSKLQNFPWSKK